MATIGSPESPPESGDSFKQATAEALSLGEGTDLEREAKKNQHRRREKLKDHMGKGAIVAFWIFFWVVILITTSGGLIWAYHMLTPEKWHFLTDNQVNTIEDHVFTALVGGVFAFFSKQKFLD